MAALLCIVACSGGKDSIPEAAPSDDTVSGGNASQHIAEFEGLYASSFERSAFKPCDVDERWWAEFWTDDPDAMGVAMGVDLNDPAWLDLQAANRYLRVRGGVQRADNLMEDFGHMGKYRGRLFITEILEARDASELEIERCR
ncbi:hypothetical protein ACQKH5_04235 [Hyphomonas sp. NPDC076900]|uniref:hypothetical protein n=1 Tax=unclassified Hyphomonas TaxID=2630699 RepID=UPI003CFD72BA